MHKLVFKSYVNIGVYVGVNMDVNIGESKSNWYGMVLEVDLERLGDSIGWYMYGMGLHGT